MSASVPLLLVFQLRADMRAYLLQRCEFPTWDDAFGPLFDWAIVRGLAADVGMAALTAIADRACSDAGVEFE